MKTVHKQHEVGTYLTFENVILISNTTKPITIWIVEILWLSIITDKAPTLSNLLTPQLSFFISNLYLRLTQDKDKYLPLHPLQSRAPLVPFQHAWL